jgi:hypothetical protein
VRTRWRHDALADGREWRVIRSRSALTVSIVAALAILVGTPSPAATTRWAPRPWQRYQLLLSQTPTEAQLKGPFAVMELDGFDTPTATVTALHRLGKKAVCYIDVGTWENWRPDAKQFPPDVLGKPDAGWPGERWLDIRQTSILLPIMEARFAMCVRKGFDAIDPDNVDGVENDTGFPLTAKEQLTYDRDIATAAHADGLSVALKSDADEARALEGSFDFVVNEQCVQYDECGELQSFVKHRKAVYDIEYTDTLGFCHKLPRGIDGMAKHLALGAWVRWCP